MVKGIKDFVRFRVELIGFVGQNWENFTFKSSINNLKIQTKNPETYRAIIHFFKTQKQDFTPIKCKKTKPTI